MALTALDRNGNYMLGRTKRVMFQVRISFPRKELLRVSLQLRLFHERENRVVWQCSSSVNANDSSAEKHSLWLEEWKQRIYAHQGTDRHVLVKLPHEHTNQLGITRWRQQSKSETSERLLQPRELQRVIDMQWEESQRHL